MNILSNTVAGYFGENWGSNALIHLKPQILAKMLQYYPNEAQLLTYMRMAGNIISVSGPTMSVYYDGAMERTIVTGAAIAATAAGATLSMTLDASNYDSANAVILREDYTVLIPPQFLTGTRIVPKPFQVVYGGTTGSPGALTFTLKPLDSTVGTIGIPAGTQLILGSTNYSRGAGQPVSKVDYEYESTFTTQIVKDTLTIEGGIAAFKRWRDEFENGGTNTVLRGMEKMNFSFDSQIEKAIWLGQQNTNSVTTTNTVGGTARTVLGTKGVLQHMETESMTLPYDPNSYQLQNLEAIKPLLESQMVTEREVNAFVGPDYLQRYEHAGITWLGQNSHTDLTKKFEQINYPLRSTYMNGVTLNFVEMTGWSNPVSYGAPGYPLRDMAMFFPNTQSEAKLGSKDANKIMLNNLTIGYLNYGGEDRTRILKKVDGMTGLELDGVNQFDEFNTYMLSELMVLFLNPNQAILSYAQPTI